MSHHVSIVRVCDTDGRWFVDVYVDEELHERLAASSGDEAQRMLDDIVAMAEESGGKVRPE